jgi:biopolymer transport protein ExbD
MRGVATVLLITTLSASAGPVFEFNGDLWHPIPTAKLFEKSGKKTVTFIADAGTPMIEFDELFGALRNHSNAERVKFQLRKQHRNVVVTCAGEWRASEGSPLDTEEKIVLTTTGPQGTFLMHADVFGTESARSARLNQNLEGIQNFLNVAGHAFRIPEGAPQEAIPMAGVVARSNCSFGQFLTVIQLLNQAGCREIGLAVNDVVPDPDLDVIIEMDKEVAVPIARHPARQDERARIVVTIDDDAVPMNEEGAKLVDDDAVLGYLEERRSEVEELNLNPRVHLRAVETVHFSHVRRVIRLAARRGLHEVIFVSLAQAQIRELLEERERDLEMQLPKADPQDQQVALQPLLILIDAQGAIFLNTGLAREPLDQKAVEGELPMLEQRVEIYAAAARAGNDKPLVQIHVDGNAQQSRVLEVLNVLAKYKVDQVTFTDIIEDE